MKIHFLGTNGWYSSPTGNTICTLLDTERAYIVLDAGDGIQKLDAYITEDKPVYILISHLHLDHIIGFHIMPKFKFLNPVTVFVAEELLANVKNLVRDPFTAAWENIGLNIALKYFSVAGQLPFEIQYRQLNHTGITYGFRLNFDGKIIAYGCDTGSCDAVKELGRQADVFILECSMKKGDSAGDWGHLDPVAAAKIAEEAGAKKLVLTHFSANEYHTLKQREIAGSFAKEIFPEVVVARDGQSIVI
jgi:ribonuclease BN (tRNA processing enzyme)